VKPTQKSKAIELRRSGYSFREISEQLCVSKSTASLWTRNVSMSTKGLVRMQNLIQNSQQIGGKMQRDRKLARLDHAEEISRKFLSDDRSPIYSKIVALSMMYWCEGAKDDRSVAFINSDPNLIRAFIKLLKVIFKTDKNKFRILLHLHDYHDEKENIDFWAKVTGIPTGQFTKVYIKKSNHKFSNKGYRGCVRISYYDAHVARVILSFAKNFIKLYI
jgi:hypothetical protein